LGQARYNTGLAGSGSTRECIGQGVMLHLAALLQLLLLLLLLMMKKLAVGLMMALMLSR